jgi:hypothetical protein
VSHDRAFLRALATRVVELSPEGPRVYHGSYDDAGLRPVCSQAGASPASAVLSLGSAYLSASMALSLLSMQLLLWSTERRSPELARARPAGVWAGRLAALLSVAIVVLMVTRPGARPVPSAAPATDAAAAPSQP